MTTKFHKYTLKGEQSVDEAQRALGDTATEGTIVRVDNVGGQTHVYVASQGTSTPKAASTGAKSAAKKKAATASSIKGVEVSESDVMKMG